MNIRPISSLVILFLLLTSPISAQSKPPSPNGGGPSKPQQSQAQNPDQKTTKDQHGTEQSPIFIKVLPTPKTETEAAQDRKDREEKSANDQAIFEFNNKLIMLGWFQFAVFVGQLFVFGYQAWKLRQTVVAAAEQSEAMERSIIEASRSAYAMEESARHMAISAQAATESVAATKERTARQMRAYLSVIIGDGIYQERDRHLKFEAKPLVINTGRTPAHKVGYRAKAAILPVPLPGDFAFLLPEKSTGAATLGPQQNFILSGIVDDFFDDKEVEKIKRSEGRALYIWGIVTYEDVFGESWKTEFCHSLGWLSNGKIIGYYSNNHNDST